MPPRGKSWLGVMALLAVMSFPVQSEPSRSDVSKEINAIINAATAVIAGLQDKINAGSLRAEEVDPAKLRQALLEQFKTLAKGDWQQAYDSERDEIRKAFTEAFDAVTGTYRADMVKGGQDAFVPAFFRAQLLEHFNKRSQGRYQAIVTTRSTELISRDAAPDRVIADKAVLAFVADLLGRGETEPKSTNIGQRFVSYWPMKITEPCATCHQRSGLDQKVGDFGGATIIIVEPKL